jgi:hypothetical protein
VNTNATTPATSKAKPTASAIRPGVSRNGQCVTATRIAGATTMSPNMSPSHHVRSVVPKSAASISPPARRLVVPIVALMAVLVTAARRMSQITSAARSSVGRKPTRAVSR